MEQKQNAGYTILDTVSHGDIRYVLGHNPNNDLSPYVTWRQFGEDSYELPHYCQDELQAKRDLFTRILAALPEQEAENPRELRLEIVPDEDPPNPRAEYDNFGAMVCWHRRYLLGDKHNFVTMQDFKEAVNENNAVILPVYMYDHSSIAISTRSFVGRAQHAEWDSGLLGFIYATFDKIKSEFGELSEKTKKQALTLLNGEAEEYGHYLNGNVYGYRILENDEEVDSCWGFIGTEDEVKATMRETAPLEYRHLFDEEQAYEFEEAGMG